MPRTIDEIRKRYLGKMPAVKHDVVEDVVTLLEEINKLRTELEGVHEMFVDGNEDDVVIHYPYTAQGVATVLGKQPAAWVLEEINEIANERTG